MKYDRNNPFAVAIAFEFGKLRYDLDKIAEEHRAELDKIFEDCRKKQKEIFEEANAKIAEIMNK